MRLLSFNSTNLCRKKPKLSKTEMSDQRETARSLPKLRSTRNLLAEDRQVPRNLQPRRRKSPRQRLRRRRVRSPSLLLSQPTKKSGFALTLSPSDAIGLNCQAMPRPIGLRPNDSSYRKLGRGNVRAGVSAGRWICPEDFRAPLQRFQSRHAFLRLVQQSTYGKGFGNESDDAWFL